MNGHLLLLPSQAVLAIFLLLFFLNRRQNFGVGALIVLLGVFQPLQNLLAILMSIEIATGWVVNPGAIVLLPVSLFIFLLLDAQKRRPTIADVVLILFFANLAYTLLCLSFAYRQEGISDTFRFVRALFYLPTRLSLGGTGILLFDFWLLLKGWDILNRSWQTPHENDFHHPNNPLFPKKGTRIGMGLDYA